MKYLSSNLLLLLVGSTGTLNAASGSWLSLPANANWSDSLNWTGGTIPGATGETTNIDTATFGNSTGLAVTVDTGRNVQNINFTANNAYTIGGGSLLLTSGGMIYANGSSSSQTIAATSSLIVQGDGGNYTIRTDTPGTSRLFTVAAPVSGVSTVGNTTVLTLDGASGAANLISGGISDGAAGGRTAVVKSGSGLWVYSGANAYTGGTTVNAGTLRLSGSGNTTGLIGPGVFTLNGGTLRLQSTTSTTVNNDVVVGASGGFISVRTNDNFNPNSLTGTGVLSLNSDNGLTITSTDFKGFAGTIRVAPLTSSTTSLRLGSSFVNNSMANASVQLDAGASLNRQNGTNSTVTMDIGALSGDAGSFLGGSAAGSGTFVYSVGSRNENSAFAGAVTDGSTKTGFTKVGSGTQTFSGTSTYTGATTVSAGTLMVNGALGATATAVNGTATVGGTGTIGGAVTVGSSAFIAAGDNGIESLGLNSAILNGTLLAQIDGTGGGSADVLNVTGNFDITGGTVNFSTLGIGPDDASYVFATYGSLTGANFASVMNLPTGYGIDYMFGGTNSIALVAIPEPGGAMPVALGVLALLWRRRS